MKKLIFISIVAGISLLFFLECFGQSILVCSAKKIALFDPKGVSDVSVEVNDDNSTTIFVGLDTNTPRIKGNMGENPLRVIRRTSEGLWLAEEPPLGGVNLWTIFFKKKMFTCSKQYPLMSGNPLGVMFMGYCE